MSEYDLFISYRRKDAQWVDELLGTLNAFGISYWLDRNEIEDAASIQHSIEQGLAQSRALLAWYTIDYPASRACQWELTAALIVAGAETAAVHRLLIVNPESGIEHVQPLQVRDLQFLPFSGDFGELALRISEKLSLIQTTFGALRRITRPRWYGLHGLGSNRFVGRTVDLWKIHSALSAGNFAIVSGMPTPSSGGELTQLRGSGGIGKSILAEEYAARFGSFWPGGIFWLNANGNANIPAESANDLLARREATYSRQLASFALNLGIDVGKGTDQDLRAALGFHLHEPYLWIVDDLPSLNRHELEPWLAPSSSGRTLLTTRSRRLDGLGELIDLGQLPPEDAWVLLTLDHPPCDDEVEAVEQILEYLAGHALALDIARAACRYLGYVRFCMRLGQQDRDALEFAAQIAKDLPNGHNPYIAATLLTSVARLDERGRDVLRLASLLAAAPIPVVLLVNVLACADHLDPLAAEDQAIIGLQQLEENSLAEQSIAGGTYSVHNLVSHTIRHHDTGKERLEVLRTAAITVLGQMMLSAADIHEHKQLAPFIPHVHILAQVGNTFMDLNLALWLGRYELEAGRYHAAETVLRCAYKNSKILMGDEHPFTLTCINNLAQVLWSQGDLSGARDMEQSVLETSCRVLGEEHPDTLISMNNLAETLESQGDLIGVRDLKEKVLEIRSRVLGKEHPHTLDSMNNLASTLSSQGDLPGARALEEEVLAIRNRVLGVEHLETLTAMNNLASTLFSQGDLLGARTLGEKVLEISSRVLGEEHRNTLTSMNNLAITMRSQGDLNGARAIQEKELKLCSLALGEEHPDTLKTISNLARTLWSQGDLPGARVLEEKVLNIRRRMLGERHPDTTGSAWSLIMILNKLGEKEASRDVIQAHLLWLLACNPIALNADQKSILQMLKDLQ